MKILSLKKLILWNKKKFRVGINTVLTLAKAYFSPKEVIREKRVNRGQNLNFKDPVRQISFFENLIKSWSAESRNAVTESRLK